MSPFIMEETKSTPYINFDDTKNLLLIRGESYPENTAGFYAPVFNWLEDYLSGTIAGITVNLQITYFNSSSSKVLMDFFNLLEEAAGRGTAVAVNWLYHEENDMSLEYGEEFKEEMEKVTFNLIQYAD